MPAQNNPASMQINSDVLVFTGTLLRQDVIHLWPQLNKHKADIRLIDISAVEHIDSAGLALLTELSERHSATLLGQPTELADLCAAYRLTLPAPSPA